MNMELSRRYPDEPAGPFPEPPATFTDAEGRRLSIEALGTGDEVHESLTRMYTAFHPADRAQGIPPTGETQIRKWLSPLVENGVNAGVRLLSAEDADSNATGETDANSTLGDEPGGHPYVGHAVLVPDTDEPGSITDPADYEWELAIFVLQDYQGAGIGTELLAHLLGEASARGIDHVWLTVERWNGAAIRLYEQIGFETVGSESFDLEMSIRLDGA